MSRRFLKERKPIVAIYETDAGQSFTDDTPAVVNFEDKIIDSNNCVTTGSSWVFRAPKSGVYLVASHIKWQTVANFNDGAMRVRVNASIKSEKGLFGGILLGYYQITSFVSLSSGDTVDIQLNQNSTDSSARSLSTSGYQNRVFIFYLGNI